MNCLDIKGCVGVSIWVYSSLLSL